ncbi:MAG: hypothetical protein HAW62_01935 [Endozoicomonadaceae bacterium]|nr:hypothetical protein [Endozoicomonadaceae bacterium]
MMQLKLSGYLKQINGLIVGPFMKTIDTCIPFGQSETQVIANCVKHYDYPICFHFPAGHDSDNRTLIFNQPMTLTVTETGSTLMQNTPKNRY